MSWSFSFNGPALDVARAGEMYLEKANAQDEVEEQLRCRFVHLLVVSCHGMKDKLVSAIASGHLSPLGHTVNITIEPMVEPEADPTVVKPKEKP